MGGAGGGVAGVGVAGLGVAGVGVDGRGVERGAFGLGFGAGVAAFGVGGKARISSRARRNWRLFSSSTGAVCCACK
jgi:hypothetical protein